MSVRTLHRIGERGCRVSVLERRAGGNLYLGVYDPSVGGRRIESLGHRNMDGAIEEAAEAYVRLRKGLDALRRDEVTLGTIFDLYLRHATPGKSVTEQAADPRRAEMFLRVFSSVQPGELTGAQWERFQRDRATGAINANGLRADRVEAARREAIAAGKPGPKLPRPARVVAPRTVEADCKWLRDVLSWATRFRIEGGRPLLAASPLRELSIPTGEKALRLYPPGLIESGDVDAEPARPIYPPHRYEEVLGALEKAVRAETGSYRLLLAYALLPVVRWQGRRIASVRKLWWSDLDLRPIVPGKDYGSIDFSARADKQRKAWRAIPLTPQARGALEWWRAQRSEVGKLPVFPSPTDPSQPIAKRYAGEVLEAAEALAKVEPMAGLGWHGFRRLRATEFKHSTVPLRDVATFLGMSIATLQTIYQREDADALQAAALYNPIPVRSLGESSQISEGRSRRT